jgi:hypothetical protein
MFWCIKDSHSPFVNKLEEIRQWKVWSFWTYSIYANLSNERSDGGMRLPIVGELAFSVFQFKRWVPYDFWFLTQGRSRFKFRDVDGCENNQFYLCLNSILIKSSIWWNISLALLVMTNYCKDVQILILNYVIKEIMFLWRNLEQRGNNHELSILTSQLWMKGWTQWC